MSGQAKRSRVLAAQRHREQVARAIAQADLLAPLVKGEPVQFDVAKAREYGERLIAEGIVDADREEAYGRVDAAHRLRGRARTGRRLLAALEGQPSECQGSLAGLGREVGEQVTPGRWTIVGCPDCHGTGHNLHGVLPPAEWSMQVRRKVNDAVAIPRNASRLRSNDVEVGNDGWTHGVSEQCNWSGPTRVVPRGEHRRAVDRVDNRGWYPKKTPIVRALSLLPRWRRGEIKHAEQRRTRPRRVARVADERDGFDLAAVQRFMQQRRTQEPGRT